MYCYDTPQVGLTGTWGLALLPPPDQSWHWDPNPSLALCTGWWLVENEDQQKAWFPAPYLEAAAQEAGSMQGSSGMTLAPPPGPRMAPKWEGRQGHILDAHSCSGVEWVPREDSPKCEGGPGLLPQVVPGSQSWLLNATMTYKHPFPGIQFCASHAYKGSRTDELSVPAGARVQVLETSDRGWWLCRYTIVGLWQTLPMG